MSNYATRRRTIIKLYSSLAAIFIILGTVRASGQVATGTPSFGSFGGGPFDTVNLGNLNVHFAIPILNKAGRGMPFAYNLSYDSSVWTPVTSSGVKQWQPASNWGWTSTYAAFGYVLQTSGSGSSGCVSEAQQQVHYTWTYWSTYGYGDQFGVFHPASIYTILYSPSAGQCGLSSTRTGSATASDGSGYTLSANLGSVTVTSRSGRVISAPISGSAPSGSFTDANGNEITENTSGQFFDTLSSTTPVLTIAGGGTPSSPLTFTYTAPSGGNAVYTVNYTQYTVQTDFGVTGVSEYGRLSNALVSGITLPDGTSYAFSYETTPGSCTPLPDTYSTCVTGRITSVTLPTGGEVTYSYSSSGGTNGTGIYSDGSTAGLTRILSPSTSCSSGGCWQYSRALVTGTPGPKSTWTTTVSDPNDNQTAINFAEDTPTYNVYETERQMYQGSISATSCSSTITNNCLLLTTVKCYNANYASCSSAAVSSPITQIDAYSQPANGTNRLSAVLYNAYGQVTDDKEYNYGVTLGAAPSSSYLVRETAVQYATLGNGIVNKPSSVIVYDWTSGSKVELSSSAYSYDQTTPTATSGTPQHVAVTGSRGNLTTATMSTSSTASLSRTYTYYDTGNPYVATDVNSAQTTYVYASGSCGNSFATTINEPLSLSRSITWNCTGGVATKVTDENGNNVTSNYTDTDFWRPASVYDQETNETTMTYHSQTAMEAALQNFNSGNSVSDSRTCVDGFGRPILSQRLQGPGATNYDTVETDYNSLGQPSRSTMPFSAAACTTNSTAPGVNTTYDALGRVLTATDANGGKTSYTYTQNDILQVVSGTQTFQKQLEYDGLGRLTSVCEISSTLPLAGTCGQSNSKTGLWTKYTYDALGHLLTVTQNAQAASNSQQARSFAYDWLGRMTSETNPESGVTQYFYDSAPTTPGISCVYSAGNGLPGNTGSYPGNLAKKYDADGISTCYAYDGLHRVLGITHSGSGTNQFFVYDAATVNGVQMTNTATRMAEAFTAATSSYTKLTDEGFNYSPRGETADLYESTPHSGGYYHSTAAYWATGALQSLSGIPSVPTIYYGASNGSGLDGEGRYTQVTASSGTNPVSSVSYSTSSTTNPLGALTGVTFGSADSDSFTYDPNTGRMKTYTFSVNGQTDAGTLNWNSNGTLASLAIVDNIPGTNDTETCNYQYDDAQRISSSLCGSIWQQNFTYDSFGNITKSGSLAFTPTYSPTTNQFTLSGANVQYDADGNLLTDNLNTYTWDTDGKMATVSNGSVTVTATYDALGRMVENNAGSTWTQFVYGPTGAKLAKANGTTLIKAFVALPGGAKAIYNSSGTLAYYRHSDWLGSSRLTSTQARGLYASTAYAPFGEQYAPAGTGDPSFTGQDPDTMSTLYDFPARRQSPSQGRWISPDPAGRSAVSLANPQSWNRYSYVMNNPLMLIDPTGMEGEDCPLEDDDGNCVDDGSDGGDDGNSGGNNSDCDPTGTQCQQQETDQALLNAALAILTNSDCAALIGGPSSAGQAAVAEDILGQLFGNPNPFIQFNANPDDSLSGIAFATTTQGPVPVQLGNQSSLMPGAVIQLGPDFYNPTSYYPTAFSFAQNQEATLLEEFGHAEGELAATGYGYGTSTQLFNDTDSSSMSIANGLLIDNTCLNELGNVPTQDPQINEPMH